MSIKIVDDEILCPVCGGNYLHHTKVELFERNDDEESGLYILVDGKDVQIKHDSLDGNPSKRRNGLKIYFYCEHCPETPVLSISQHKGQSLIEWNW